MRNFRIILQSFLLMGLLLPVMASATLYEAELAVTDQSVEVRQQAMRQGLEDVLVRVSGYSLVVTEPAIKPLLANAGRYVQQYNYRPLEQDSIPDQVVTLTTTDSQDEPQLPQFVLWLRFDQRAINQMLHQSGMTVWGGQRPQVLAWIAIEEAGRRQLVGANDKGLARDVLERAAKRRALPIQLPLLDLRDTNAVRVGDIWGEFHDEVKEASRRYQRDAILIGRLYPLRAGGWGSRWTLYQGEERFYWERQNENATALLNAGVDGAADNLSLLYAERFESGADNAVLRVEGVDSFSDFQRVMNYLNKLNGVAMVQVISVEQQAVILQLEFDGGMDLVLQTIKQQGVMLPVVEMEQAVTQQDMPEPPLKAVQRDVNKGGSAVNLRIYRLVQ